MPFLTEPVLPDLIQMGSVRHFIGSGFKFSTIK
jgi:hypothetical protein